MLHQVAQGIERFGGEFYRPAVAARGQPALCGQQAEVAEVVNAVSLAAFIHFPPASEGFRRFQLTPKASSGLLRDSRLQLLTELGRRKAARPVEATVHKEC